MVDPVVNDGDDILAASWVAEFRNIIDNLLSTLDLGSAAATSLHPTGAAGTGMYFPTTSILAFALAGSEVARWSSGALLTGHTVATGASPGDVVATNNRRFAFLQSGLTTSANFGIKGDASNFMLYDVPATGGVHQFRWNAIGGIQLQWASGPQLVFLGESIPPVLTTNQGALYTVDDGGVTRLIFQNDSASYVLNP